MTTPQTRWERRQRWRRWLERVGPFVLMAALVSGALYCSRQPDPDGVVRPGGAYAFIGVVVVIAVVFFYWKPWTRGSRTINRD